MNSNNSKISLTDLILTFLKIGAIGFGGGVAMLALLRKYLVIEKKWITDDDLAKAVTLGQMIPGPFVPNYVEFIGYRLRGIKGMMASVIAFLFPGVLAILVLSYIYFHTQQVLLLNDIFAWIQPVIIGILAWASFDMAKLYLKDVKSFIIAGFALVASIFRIEPIIIILICGALGIILTQRKFQVLFSFFPYFFLVGAGKFLIKVENIVSLFLIFLKIGAVIFGGGYSAIPFIAEEVVGIRQWLTNQELITGIALSQITPGPVAILATFVGFKVSGIIGALIATTAIFLPSFIILLIILTVYDYLRKKNSNVKISNYLQGFLSGVKPAIVGFLISATIILALNHDVLVTNLISVSIVRVLFMVASFILLIKYKTSPVWLILGGASLGFLLTRAPIF
jgi:chromate transporter